MDPKVLQSCSYALTLVVILFAGAAVAAPNDKNQNDMKKLRLCKERSEFNFDQWDTKRAADACEKFLLRRLTCMKDARLTGFDEAEKGRVEEMCNCIGTRAIERSFLGRKGGGSPENQCGYIDWLVEKSRERDRLYRKARERRKAE